jgi:hypothetical protein
VPAVDELMTRIARTWPLPIWLAAGAIVAYVLRRALRRLLTPRGPTEPQCRACGYPTRGLPGHVCPECGNDLRGRGTAWPDRPVPRQPLSLRRRAISLTLLFLVWWPAADELLTPYVPRWETVRRNGRLSVVAEGLHPLPLRAREMYLEVWNSDDQYHQRAQRMIIDPTTLGYGYWRSTGERVERPSGLNEAVIRDLMETMDVAVSGREVADTMHEILDSRFIVYHPYPYSTVARVRATVLWWSLWLICIVVMALRAVRRRQQSALAIPAASVTN